MFERPREDSVVDLEEFAMARAGGGIEGTLRDAGTGKDMTSRTYFVAAVDSEGLIATASGYSDFAGPVTGEYCTKGLRPGIYYILALVAPLSDTYQQAQWYGVVNVPISIVLEATKLDPPVDALPVVVGEGLTSGVDMVFDLATGVSSNFPEAIPRAYSLSQNDPNPFNPGTSIEFSLPAAGLVTLRVYNILGEEVATLVAGDHAAGTFSTSWDASGHASGVYSYRLTAGEYVQTRKMVLLR